MEQALHNNRFETHSPIVMEFANPALIGQGKLHANYGSELKRLLYGS
jgi:hypothetical protein